MAKVWLWAQWVILPIVIVLFIDQETKAWSAGLTEPLIWQHLQIVPFANSGFMLGAMQGLSKFYTVVLPATIGAQCLFLFAVIQYFVPLRSPIFRLGLSIFLAGILGNIADRILLGHVRDFILLTWGSQQSGVFNLADAAQWLGVSLALGSYLANGKLLFPANERRGRKWIDPPFQGKFSLILVVAGLCFSTIAGTLFYTFLRTVVAELTALSFANAHRFGALFLYCYLGITFCYLASIFILGIYLSHRIVGPIKGFENFLEDLLRGTSRNLKLREGDEFRRFEEMAARFQDFFHTRLGINPIGLKAGDALPRFAGETFDHQFVSRDDILGKRTLFLFYRYATCPLCVLHLEEIAPLIKKATTAGITVLAVFETKAEDFASLEAEGRTRKLLAEIGIPLIADPKREVYRAFRSQVNPLTLFHPQIGKTLIRALLRGFRQRKILGRFGQLPAYFFVGESGMLEEAYYGEHFADLLSLETMEKLIERYR